MMKEQSPNFEIFHLSIPVPPVQEEGQSGGARKDSTGENRTGKDGAGQNRASETRIAVIGIIVEDKESAESVNAILHQYSRYIIGRMGLPYEKKKVSIISVVVDAPQDSISALSGKLGRLRGVSSKALYSKAVAD